MRNRCLPSFSLYRFLPPTTHVISSSPAPNYLPLVSLALATVACAATGCKRDDAAHVVLYTSVDQPVAEPVVREFERRTGIRVDLQTDTEATKSAGLAARLQAERANPRADVWWGNEVFHTINLAEQGVLEAYESPSAGDIPGKFKDPGHRWAGSALRARVVGVHEGGPGEKVTGLEDLTAERFKGRVAMAAPTAGTTGGHVAALYVLWGDEKADDYFRRLRANGVGKAPDASGPGIPLLGGNSEVARQVAAGAAWVGLTDNDDVDDARRSGEPVRMVLPDQGPGGQGTLTIPCTVGLVAGARHPDAARRLIDYLLSVEVERKLIEAKFGRYPVRGGGDEVVRTMDVDYRKVARKLPDAVGRVTRILGGGEEK